MTIHEHDVVAALANVIAQRIGEPRYNFWFRDNTKFFWENDLLTVGAPNRFFQEWLESKFGEEVRTAAGEVLGQPMRVRFIIDAGLFQASRRAQGEASRVESAAELDSRAESAPAEPVRPAPSPAARRSSAHPRRWRRLDDFIVGPCNRLAHAAALSVIEAPAEHANPLVLHGPVGVGKTHLLEGICAGLRHHQREACVRFVPAEEFTHRFVQAVRAGKLAGFRKQHRECDALLLDDLNFLAGKRATQEEFLHTFDALLAAGRQVVLTCDCHPKLADDYLPELCDRLLGGAVWGLTPPESATRLAILRARAAAGAGNFPDGVLRLLAEKLQGNVRELEGAVHSVRHYARVLGRAIDVDLAREALGDLLRHSVRAVRLTDVDEGVCRALHLSAGALQSRQRSWAVSHPRMLAMYLSRRHTAAACSEIGQHFGGRNHSTVVAAEKKVRRWLKEDAEVLVTDRRMRVRELIERIEHELRR